MSTDPPRDFDAVYAEHAAFVWRALRALGVAPAQLDDAMQDVFVVVHQKLESFDGEARLTTWLFAIARRIASHYRRAAGRAARSEAVDHEIASETSTFEETSRREAAALVTAILAELDDDKRDLLVLVELEQVPVPEVAAYLGIPLNTAYSRLRLARRAFDAALARRRGGRR
ncbi:MAG TPA: sigma-70 family RNA polymerase sigma factor [Kofleriaceae bacterium]|nr:sigma-70 family RNA polymerase sigma factor [Kofleriaceae bacterium]